MNDLNSIFVKGVMHPFFGERASNDGRFHSLHQRMHTAKKTVVTTEWTAARKLWITLGMEATDDYRDELLLATTSVRLSRVPTFR
jgi:hypothetical protein